MNQPCVHRNVGESWLNEFQLDQHISVMSAEKIPYIYRASSDVTPSNELTNHCPAKQQASLEKQGVFGQGGSIQHQCLSTHRCYKGFLGFNCKLTSASSKDHLGFARFHPKPKPPSPTSPLVLATITFFAFSFWQTK